jgi:hypothetical protein
MFNVARLALLCWERCAVQAIPSAFVHTPWKQTGPAWSRWSTLRLTNLDQAGPVCSALPGRRLSGWRYPLPIPEIEVPAGGSWVSDPKPASICLAGYPKRAPVDASMSRVAGGWNRRVRAQRSARGADPVRRAAGPAPIEATRAAHPGRFKPEQKFLTRQG